MTEANINTQIVCRVCGESKKKEFFPKSTTGKYGRTTRCKPCTKVYLQEYYSKNAEKIKSQQANWYVKNIQSQREYRKTDYEKNKERYKERALDWSRANPEKRKSVQQKYDAADPVRKYEKNKKHRLSNPGMYAAHFKMRQQKLKRALSPWADSKAMEAFYVESARLTKETGVKHHVDH